MFELGTIVAGKYLVDRVLGQGGMGIVVRATHLQLEQPVAIKFLLPGTTHEVVQRFSREARAAVRLRSEHVARVFDVGSLDNGTPYMVLEYLEGTDLARFPRARLGVGGLVDLMLQACEALAEAHTLGIVHRDIKPSNFFITQSPGGAPLLKLLDFGISKTRGTSSNLTASQVVLGTPAYMSPEQMRASRKVDHRSDIWSLGIVLYELLQGSPPFESEAFSSLVLQVVGEPLPNLTVSLPPGLAHVVYRCLEKDPARRFQTAGELAGALAPYAHSPAQAAITLQRTRGLVGLPAGPAIEPRNDAPSLLSTISEASGVKKKSAHRARRWSMAAFAAILLGVVAGAIASMRASGTATETTAGSPVQAQPSSAASAASALDAQPLASVGRTVHPDAGVIDAPSDAPVVDAAAAPAARPSPAPREPAPRKKERGHGSTPDIAPRPRFDRGD